MTNRAFMKETARRSMRGRKPNLYLVVLIYLVICYVLDILSVKLLYPRMDLEAIMEYYTDAFSADGSAAYIYGSSGANVIGSVLRLVIAMMSAVLGTGFTGYCLRVSRGEAAGIGNIFDVFGIFFKVIWLQIVTSFFVILWSLLLVIPGIVAAYRYSMAVYVLLDNPELSVMECIRRSKEITMGHKGELFVLNLSFIGWNLLTVIIPFVGIFAAPYQQITIANYYNALSGFRPEPERPGEYGGSYDNDREPWDS